MGNLKERKIYSFTAPIYSRIHGNKSFITQSLSMLFSASYLCMDSSRPYKNGEFSTHTKAWRLDKHFFVLKDWCPVKGTARWNWVKNCFPLWNGFPQKLLDGFCCVTSRFENKKEYYNLQEEIFCTTFHFLFRKL